MIHVAALLGEYIATCGITVVAVPEDGGIAVPVSSLPQLFGEMRHDGAYPPSKRIEQIVMGVTALKRRLEADCVRITHAPHTT
jgi:hypothetical protein